MARAGSRRWVIAGSKQIRSARRQEQKVRDAPVECGHCRQYTALYVPSDLLVGDVVLPIDRYDYREPMKTRHLERDAVVLLDGFDEGVSYRVVAG